MDQPHVNRGNRRSELIWVYLVQKNSFPVIHRKRHSCYDLCLMTRAGTPTAVQQSEYRGSRHHPLQEWTILRCLSRR